MPVQIFDTKDAIPDAQRETAIESKDGKFHVFTDEDTTSLRSAAEKERNRAAELDKEVKRLTREATERARAEEAGRAGVTSEKLKEIEAQIRADLEEQYRPHKEKAEKFDQLSRKVQLDDPVKSTMLSEKVGVLGPKVDKLWTLIKDQFDLTADGKPMVKDHPGMTVEQYLATEVKKEYPEWFKGTQAAGSGAGGGGGGGGGSGAAPNKPPTQWTSDERAAYIQQHGQAAYRELLNQQIREGVAKKGG